MNVTSDDEERSAALCFAANIPRAFHRKKFADLGVTGQTLSEYMRRNYAEDFENRIGLFCYGRADVRVQTFAVLARAFALRFDNVFFTRMRWFANYVSNPDKYAENEGYERVMSCNTLFLDGFFDDSVPTPYSSFERSHIETTLIDLIENGHRVCVSSAASLEQCVWWSNDFRAAFASGVRKLGI